MHLGGSGSAASIRGVAGGLEEMLRDLGVRFI